MAMNNGMQVKQCVSDWEKGSSVAMCLSNMLQHNEHIVLQYPFGWDADPSKWKVKVYAWRILPVSM